MFSLTTIPGKRGHSGARVLAAFGAALAGAGEALSCSAGRGTSRSVSLSVRDGPLRPDLALMWQALLLPERLRESGDVTEISDNFANAIDHPQIYASCLEIEVHPSLDTVKVRVTQEAT